MRAFTKGFGVLFVVVVTAVALQFSARPSVKSSPTVTADIIPKNNTDGPMMLELYAPYCPSCNQMAPLVRALAENCAAEGVSVVQYDISTTENEHLVEELDIEAVPTFLFFDQTGKESARLVGKQSEDTLRSKLSGIGGRACDGRS